MFSHNFALAAEQSIFFSNYNFSVPWEQKSMFLFTPQVRHLEVYIFKDKKPDKSWNKTYSQL